MAEVEVSAQVTLDLDDTVYDPLTGQMTTTIPLDMGTTRSRVETGYTTGGDIVVAEYDLDAPGDATMRLVNEPRAARGIGDGHVILDGSNQPIPVPQAAGGGGGGGSGSVPSPMVGLSEYEEVGVLGDGILLSEEEAAALTSPGPAGVMGAAAGAPAAERLPGGGLRFRMDPGPGSGPAGRGVTAGTGTLTRTYRPGRSRGGEAALVLAEVVFEVDEPAGRGRTRTRETVRFKAVDWQRNERRDDERRARPRRSGGVGHAPAPGPSSASGLTSPALCEGEIGVLGSGEVGAECDGGGGGGGGGYTPPPPSTCPAGGTQNLVLQHGILSWASAAWGQPWESEKTRALLQQEYCIGALLAPTLPYLALGSHQAQADVLKAAVADSGQNGFVFVGHSQGGVVARRAAQQFVAQGRPDLVEGVVTIGTPHRGAYFAMSTKEAVANALTSRMVVDCALPFLGGACDFLTGAAMRGAIDGVLGIMVPAAVDNRPGSAALREIEQNRHTLEQPFYRYGIQHYPNKRWMPARLAGDLFLNQGGRAFVLGATLTYHGLRVASWASLIFVKFSWAYPHLRKAINTMDTLDHQYDRYTAPGMASDGVIHGPSQVYPGAHDQLPVRGRGAVSHVAETQSPETRKKLDYLFDLRFGVARR